MCEGTVLSADGFAESLSEGIIEASSVVCLINVLGRSESWRIPIFLCEWRLAGEQVVETCLVGWDCLLLLSPHHRVGSCYGWRDEGSEDPC